MSIVLTLTSGGQAVLPDPAPVIGLVTLWCSGDHPKSEAGPVMVRCMGRAIRSHVEQRPDAGASFTPAGIFARTELQRLNPGSGLFREGESPSGVYVLHSGEVALTGPPGAPSRPGRTARAGEILGLMAVISNGRHLATAVALTICEVGFIERKEFLRMVEASPSIWFSVLRQMSQDLNASYDVMRVYSERGRC